MKLPSALPAPAKVNLHLRVRGRLKNGLHELDTSFAFAEAHDLLYFEPSNSIEVSCSEQHLSGENNLVHRVLTALQQRQRVRQGLHVHIEKHLPEQAGLGGGSSDAATALIYANQAWGCGLTRAQLIDFATPFGADIPCFLFGRASLAGGIGERLVDYPAPLPRQTLLLAWPGVGLSTAAVFKHFDEKMASLSTHPQACTATLTDPERPDTMRRDALLIGRNDLEPIACELSPKIAALLDFLRANSEKAWMTGSGSACVALVDDRQAADALAAQLSGSGLAGWVRHGRLLDRHPVCCDSLQARL